VNIDLRIRRGCLLRALALIGALVVSIPQQGRAASLQSLFDGGFLVAGNCRFDNWQLVSADATTGAPFDFTLMSINPLTNDPVNPGLQFASGGQLSVAGLNAIDLTFKFQVHAAANTNSFAAHTLNMNGVNFGGPGGIAFISQEVVDVNGADLGPTLALADNINHVFQFTDDATIAPHLNLAVTMNIFMSGLVAADALNLSEFTHRFAQTGPSTQAGDFSGDRIVDGTDFLRWQRGLSPNPLSSQDLALWRSNFGKSIVAVPAATAIPEPTACSLLLVTMTAVATAVARRSCRRLNGEPRARRSRRGFAR
jgi:hypothetical protein